MNLISTYVCKVITCPGTIDHKYNNILVFYSLSTFKLFWRLWLNVYPSKRFQNQIVINSIQGMHTGIVVAQYSVSIMSINETSHYIEPVLISLFNNFHIIFHMIHNLRMFALLCLAY